MKNFSGRGESGALPAATVFRGRNARISSSRRRSTSHTTAAGKLIVVDSGTHFRPDDFAAYTRYYTTYTAHRTRAGYVASSAVRVICARARDAPPTAAACSARPSRPLLLLFQRAQEIVIVFSSPCVCARYIRLHPQRSIVVLCAPIR